MKITTAQLNLLSRSSTLSNTVTAPENISEAEQEELKKVLRYFGGTEEKPGFFLMPENIAADASKLISQLLLWADGKKISHNGDNYDRSEDLILECLRYGEIALDMMDLHILLPFAGSSTLVNELPAACIFTVQEDSTTGISDLRKMGLDPVTTPFSATAATEIEPADIILMLPPVGNNAEIQHIIHAWEFLKPGGVLVSLISESSIIYKQGAKSINAQCPGISNIQYKKVEAPFPANLVKINKHA